MLFATDNSKWALPDPGHIVSLLLSRISMIRSFLSFFLIANSDWPVRSRLPNYRGDAKSRSILLSRPFSLFLRNKCLQEID